MHNGVGDVLATLVKTVNNHLWTAKSNMVKTVGEWSRGVKTFTFLFTLYHPSLTTGPPVGSATSELNVQSGHSKEESRFHPPIIIMALSTNICDTMMDERGFPSYAHSQVVSCPNYWDNGSKPVKSGATEL